MYTVFDYIEWRGDIGMEAVPLNDIDTLILARLSYIPFGGIVPSTLVQAPVALQDAIPAVLKEVDAGTKHLRKEEDCAFLNALLDSPRFCSILLRNYVDIYSEEAEEQFSAVTLELTDGTIAVIFRGTDGTLIGWKEDFNMSFAPEVPAQQDAVSYFEQVAAFFPRKSLRLAGHSKGGNLAMYAAAFCQADMQKRIISVRNLDGPGFNDRQAAAAGFSPIAAVTLTILPESSIIGMLLDHQENSIVVSSQRLGIFQHNTYLWNVRRDGFVTKSELNDSSKLIDHTLKDWLNSLTAEQRERMIDGIFVILQASDGKTLRELWNGKNMFAVLSAAVKLDAETKANIGIAVEMLQKAVKNNAKIAPMMEKLFDTL